MNLIVMLVVWGAGMVILYRWYLAMALRRAFREEVFAEPVSGGVGDEARPGGVLNYAKPPTKMHPGRRWPFVYALFGCGIPFAMARVQV